MKRTWRPVLAALIASCASCPSGSKAPSRNESNSDRIAVFITAELKGTLEPCGCTTDPLGDLARTTKLIQAARGQGPTLVLDAGSVLFLERKISTDHADAHRAKANALRNVLSTHWRPAAIGLGPFDLVLGKDEISLPRTVANLPRGAGVPVSPHQLATVNGHKVGIFGVVDPKAVPTLPASDPIPAAKQAVHALRQQGADAIIALAQLERADAAKLARAVDGIDFIIAGLETPEPSDVEISPLKVGSSWLLQPSNRGQVITRLDLTFRDGQGFADAVGGARSRAEIERIDKQIGVIESQITEFEKDPDADADFIALKRAEVSDLKKHRQAFDTQPQRVPARGHYFTFEQIRITKALACDVDVVQTKKRLNKAVGEMNVAASKKQGPPPAPSDGDSGYAGTEECANCHEDDYEFWQGTKHGAAWKTLVDANKQFDLECTSCHVTGLDKPGGTSLALLAQGEDADVDLRNVGCEVCHGPAARHASAANQKLVPPPIPKPTERVCAQCHTPEHSDTFNYKAYLRDITGTKPGQEDGHAKALRATLGEGATGAALRKAGLRKAGAKIGAGCTK